MAWLTKKKNIKKGHLTRAPLALQIFHHLLGGGGSNTPSISAPIGLREKRKQNVWKLVKNDFDIISVIFLQKSKLWPPEKKKIKKKIKFPITEVWSDLT